MSLGSLAVKAGEFKNAGWQVAQGIPTFRPNRANMDLRFGANNAKWTFARFILRTEAQNVSYLIRHPRKKAAIKTWTNSNMSETLTDQVLVERAQKGDEIAFSELVTRHYRRAMRVAYGMLRNTDDAEDITQDAFARVHRRLKDFEGSAAFFTWLYRIVVNLSIDLLRRRRRERRADVDDKDMQSNIAEDQNQDLWPRFNDSHPGDAAERQELRANLNTALDKLPEIHRSILLLRELEGQSYEEIAHTLGIKKGTVMSRLFHARKAMQTALLAVQTKCPKAPREGIS